MQNNIHENSIVKMNEAIQKCARLVGSTMGASGINVALEEDLYPYVSVTNDGATLISKMKFTDPIEKIGHTFVKEATERSNNNSGDGSSTTVVLLAKILEEGLKVQDKISPIQLKNELDSLLPIIEQKINEQKRTITKDEVEAVATIAGESEVLGKLLGEVYKKIGKEGIVQLEGSGTYETSVNYIEGVRFADTGYLSPYLVRDEDARKEGRTETKAIYENPTILVTKKKIEHLNDINPLLETLTKQGKKDLVIFTDDMDSGVASVMVKAHKEKIINVLIIKAPVLWKGYVFEDFAKCVGATIVEDASGINFKNLKLEHLGTCGKIVTDKNETVLIGTQDLTEHIKALKEEGSNDSLLRVSWLTTKTAILKLGSKSETELSYLKLKCEDAINASRTALEDGIVVGGGVCLLNISEEMPDTIAGKIMKEALKIPAENITKNTGKETGWWFLAYEKSHGLNAKTGEIVNMWEAGIVDSAKVVKMAVRNAIGVASTILTTQSVISIPEPTAIELELIKANATRKPF
jgi:chaperonin GroEL